MAVKQLRGSFNRAKFRARCSELDISNIELAKKLHKSVTVISFWKRGKSRPKWDDLAKLGEILDIDYKTLLT